MAICKILSAPNLRSPASLLSSPALTRDYPLATPSVTFSVRITNSKEGGFVILTLASTLLLPVLPISVPGEKGFCIVDKVLREVKEIRLYVERRRKEEEGGKRPAL